MVYGCEKSKFKKLDNKIELLFLVQKKKKKQETEKKETTNDCVRIFLGRNSAERTP
jgi:hypothetical protein